MADARKQNKNKNVDDAGIRLAPSPIRNADYHVMPTVMQEFVIEPRISAPEEPEDIERPASTEKDFQPKKQDISKRWKRKKRSVNITVGVILLVLTLVMLLPYVLGAVGVWLEDLPFKYVPKQFGVINNIVEAFKATADAGWKGDTVKIIWIAMIPNLVLFVGLLGLVVNLIKSLVGIFGAVKPVKYTFGATLYLLTVVTVLICSLVGVPAVGLEKINFMTDFIRGYQTSELFSLIIFSLGYFILSLICTISCADRNGYIK